MCHGENLHQTFQFLRPLCPNLGLQRKNCRLFQQNVALEPLSLWVLLMEEQSINSNLTSSFSGEQCWQWRQPDAKDQFEEVLTGPPSCLCRWIPSSAQLFVTQKEQWVHFAPRSDYDSSRNIEEYFASIASFMSLQLRELVIKSLEDLVSFFMIHKVCRGPQTSPFQV